jgi:hypothetical protein
VINEYAFDWPLIGTIAGGALLIAVLAALWRWYRLRRAAAALLQAMTGGAYEYLRDILLPDTQGLPLHIDYLLLTARGIVVIDYRAVRGNVFGGDQMTDWTVMAGALRYTFVNPQAGLYDRMATVRALAPDTPVEGRIVFGGRAVFPKGLPSHTGQLAALAADFPAADRRAVAVLADGWMKDWSAVRAASQPSSLVEPRAAV